MKELAQECLKSPTESMRKSFRKLPPQHRWLLFALLEQRGWGSLDAVREGYERLCPDEIRRPMEDLVAQLNNAFIKKRSSGFSIEPVHPTVMDLLAEELASEVVSRRRYIELCTGEGLSVALMVQGGGRGTSVAPLLAGEAEWKLIEARALEELRSGRAHALDLLRLIARDQTDDQRQSKARAAAQRIARVTIQELNERDLWTTGSVLMFARALRGECIPLIDGAWKRQLAAVMKELGGRRPLCDSYSRLRELAELAELVTYSGWASVTDRSIVYAGICEVLGVIHDREEWSEDLDDWGSWDDDDWDSAEHDFETLEELTADLRDCLKRCRSSDPKLAERIAQTLPEAEEMRAVLGTLRSAAEEKREDIESAPPSSAPSKRVVDVDAMFNDL